MNVSIKVRTPSEIWMPYGAPTENARIRLFCFPYAGGSASIYHMWPAGLPQEIEVCPIQLPGREGRLREKPFMRLAPLLQSLSELLYPYLDRPFAFFGHSMGALISFELTRYLRRQLGISPVHLFVAAHRAPQLPNRHTPIHQLPDAQIVERLRQFQGTPETLLHNRELMKLILPMIRADFALCERYLYSPEAPLDCPLTVFGGRQDPVVTLEELQAWRTQTQGPYRRHLVTGEHFFVHDAHTLIWPELVRGLRQHSPIASQTGAITPVITQEISYVGHR